MRQRALYRWHELDPTALAAFVRTSNDRRLAYPEGRRSTGWRLQHPESPQAELTIDETTVAQQREWLHRVAPDYVVSYPSVLREIARLGQTDGKRLATKSVMTIGEMVTPASREAIRDYFGVQPIDRYGATETGLMAGVCPHSGTYHVMAEIVLVELLKDDGTAAGAAELGRVVVTPFYNFAMPLVRFEIGDYAVRGEPCGCGRTLPTISRIRGRVTDIFRFADGTSIWPDAEAAELLRYVPHRQYQLVQTAVDKVELRYVPVNPDQANDVAGLTHYLRRRLHPSLSVTAIAVADIPRSAGGKYLESLSLVPAAP